MPKVRGSLLLENQLLVGVSYRTGKGVNFFIAIINQTLEVIDMLAHLTCTRAQ